MNQAIEKTDGSHINTISDNTTAEDLNAVILEPTSNGQFYFTSTLENEVIVNISSDQHEAEFLDDTATSTEYYETVILETKNMDSSDNISLKNLLSSWGVVNVFDYFTGKKQDYYLIYILVDLII